MMDNINRYALVMQPKQELLDWVNIIFPEYLVSLRPLEDDEAPYLPAARARLRGHFKPILEQELEDW